MSTRISRDTYGLKLAEAAALRADCSRRQVGAVIVSEDGSIVATGYNGLAAGKPGCLSAGACPRGQMAYPSEPPVKVGESDPTPNVGPWCNADSPLDDVRFCTMTKGHDGGWHISGNGTRVIDVWPVEGATQPADVDYEATGCRAVHAEVNAIIRAGRDRCVGSTIYVTDEPCFHCSVVIEGAGIARVVTPSKEIPEYLQELRDAADPDAVLGSRIIVASRVALTADGTGPLEPELVAALARQEERIREARDAATRRAELAEEHAGWRA